MSFRCLVLAHPASSAAKALPLFLFASIVATALIGAGVPHGALIGWVRLSIAVMLWSIALMAYRWRSARVVIWVLAAVIPVEVVCRLVYGTFLTEGTLLSINATSISEATEILGRHPEWWSIGVPYVALVFWGLATAFRSANPFSMPRLKVSLLAGISGFIVGSSLLYVGTPEGRINRLTTVVKDIRRAIRETFPMDAVYSELVIIKGEMIVIAEANARSGFRFEGVHRQVDYEGPETYVVVIGESSRRASWSLYGAERNTNPDLSSRVGDGLYVFKNVRANANLTIFSLPLALTRATPREQWRSVREQSVVGLANQAGFETYWLSNQSKYGIFDRKVSSIAADAKHINFMPRISTEPEMYDEAYDEALLPALVSSAMPMNGNLKRIIFLHTMGSHFDYRFRYPPSHAVFSDPSHVHDPVCCAPEQQARTVDAYDDTILYTDFVLSRTIDLLSKLDQPAALLYFSDHGERMYCAASPSESFEHGLLVPSDDELDVPVLLWLSPRYRAMFPESAAAAGQNANLRTSLASIFDTFADLAHIALNRDRESSTSLLATFPVAGTRDVLAIDGSIRSEDEKNQDCGASRGP
jgi:glucan phosphoethanolaminetransferase (alkaline phosphatase superfamily)